MMSFAINSIRRKFAVTLVILCVVVWGAACTGKGGDQQGDPPRTSPSSKIPDADWSKTSLPRTPSGSYDVVDTGNAGIQLDPATAPTPVTTKLRCSHLAIQCYLATSTSAAPEMVDRCLQTVPTCQTDTPWLEQQRCCPLVCKSRYEAARASGASPDEALDVFGDDDGDCYPHLREFLRGEYP
jgi:hypothetical protein